MKKNFSFFAHLGIFFPPCILYIIPYMSCPVSYVPKCWCFLITLTFLNPWVYLSFRYPNAFGVKFLSHKMGKPKCYMLRISNQGIRVWLVFCKLVMHFCQRKIEFRMMIKALIKPINTVKACAFVQLFVGSAFGKVRPFWFICYLMFDGLISLCIL